MHVWDVLVDTHSVSSMFLAHDGHGHNKSNAKVFEYMSWNKKRRNLVHVKQLELLVQPFK